VSYDTTLEDACDVLVMGDGLRPQERIGPHMAAADLARSLSGERVPESGSPGLTSSAHAANRRSVYASIRILKLRDCLWSTYPSTGSDILPTAITRPLRRDRARPLEFYAQVCGLRPALTRIRVIHRITSNSVAL
jgi:hypothetical protein